MNTVFFQFLQEERAAELQAEAVRNRLARRAQKAKPASLRLRVPRPVLPRAASRRRSA